MTTSSTPSSAVNARSQPGVGVLFNPALIDFVETHFDKIDYLSTIPDRSWSDPGIGHPNRFSELAAPLAILNRAATRRPLVMHCIGLSICSAGVFDREYVEQLAAWRERFDCEWVSEHLSFSRVDSGHEMNASVALPIPYDQEILDLLIPRVQLIQDRLRCPFLIENNVNYFSFPDQEMTEAQFLNRLTAETGCWLLLDLHNVYTNSRNHRFDGRELLSDLNLDRVLEIHVAGGDEMLGLHTDSHAGPVLDGVWDLLEFAAPRARNLRGVTFEFHESSWPMLHDSGVLRQVERAREILSAAVAA